MQNFQELGLSHPLLSSISRLGYEKPSPVQVESIPVLMKGADLLAQAQTGTGKTAAFALPILHNLDLSKKEAQALVVAPTRELAIQIAEAFKSYAGEIKGFKVAPLYGGQDYRQQLRALDRHPHVLVATPGRLIDHIKRRSVSLEHLDTIILDEADEMLNMGFIEDIEWICAQAPESCQKGFFSATMPKSIQKITKRYLKNPEMVVIERAPMKESLIKQNYIELDQKQKLDILTRLLAMAESDGTIIFVRTKTGANELSEKLQARGYAASALHGDMNQRMRENVIQRVKKRAIDLLVATDVAARGLDIDRLTHVINYDIPYDTEAYTHRIGRTGRAGKEGQAILLVTRREKRLLRELQKIYPNALTRIHPPSTEDIALKQKQTLAKSLGNVLLKHDRLQKHLEDARALCEMLQCDGESLAAALMALSDKKKKAATSKESHSSEGEDKPRRRPRSSDRSSSDRSFSSDRYKKSGGGFKKKRASDGHGKSGGKFKKSGKPKEKRST